MSLAERRQERTPQHSVSFAETFIERSEYKRHFERNELGAPHYFFTRLRLAGLLHAGLTPLGRSDIKELAEVTFCLIANIQCVNRYIDRHCFCVPICFSNGKSEKSRPLNTESEWVPLLLTISADEKTIFAFSRVCVP